MHGVEFKDGEIELLKEALKDQDWTILPTFKLRYVYQRFTKSPKHVQEIAREARVKLGKEMEEDVERIKTNLF